MPIDYLPILVMVVIVVAFATIALFLSSIVGPHHPTPSKLSPYESGMPPIGSARRRVSIRFYLTAVLFILFDIEIVFLLPWAVVARDLGMFGFGAISVFVLLILVGYFYELGKGALKWD